MVPYAVQLQVLPVQSDVRHMLLWRRLFLPHRSAYFPPVSHMTKEEEGLALTSLSDDEGMPEESVPCGSWTPHILTVKDDIPESLTMSRHETTLGGCEERSPPASIEVIGRGAERGKSHCGSLQPDLVYISAIEHLLGQDGFEPIKDTVQEQLQSLHAHRQTDVNPTHHTQRSAKAHWEDGSAVMSEKADVRMGCGGV